MDLTKEHKKLIKAYIKVVKQKGMHPSRQDMMDAGFNRDAIRHYFTSLQNLKDQARLLQPKSFEGIIDETLFTPKQFKKLSDNARKYKRFVITTAVTGCKVHKGFLKSIKTYCKDMDATLLVLPASDPASTNGWALDAKLGKDSIVFSDLSLNSNIFISSIKMSAKHIDPVTSMDRIGQRNGTFIYASPKQRLKYVSVGKSKYAHAIMTTGAITRPNYHTNRYMSERTAYIATHDHVMGAVILEVKDDNIFHFRQIQAEKNGHFVDLGRYYQGDRIGRMDAAAVVMGDWHSGQTDPLAAQGNKELCAVVKPDYLMVHDGFNGRSINHHEKKNKIKQAMRAQLGFLRLDSELAQFAADLDSLSTWAKKQVVVVKSNHDVFLDRWLDASEFQDDPYNYPIAIKLADAMISGKNPLKFGAELYGLQNKDRVRWLSMDEDFKIARIQLGAHGHKGPNGSRGSLKGMERSYGQSVTGHSHTPEILRGAWQVGTTSLFDLEYNEGPSSWLHCSCVVYPNGARQLVNFFDGKWKL